MVGIAATVILLGAGGLVTAGGQRAFCANQSHGRAGWDGDCFSDSKRAYQQMKTHVDAYPAHANDVTTMSCTF
jgi:hypothetical protein